MCAEIPIPNEHQRRLALFNEQAEILLGSRFARAFALTFRMFFRDRDGISFREMAEIYDAPCIPAALGDDYRWARQAVNEFLDGATMCEINGERITRRRLVDVFLYGGLAHLNPDKRDDYDIWRTHPVMFALMQNEFAITLAEFFNHCGSSAR
jgi:hypothetical protein